jgi:hypothetical protein
MADHQATGAQETVLPTNREKPMYNGVLPLHWPLGVQEKACA